MGVIESRQLPCQPSPCPPLYPTLLTLPSPCPPLLHTAHCFPFSSSARVCLSPTLSNVPYSALLCNTLPYSAKLCILCILQYCILHSATLLHTLLCSYYAFYNTAYCTLPIVFYSAHCVKPYILCTLHTAQCILEDQLAHCTSMLQCTVAAHISSMVARWCWWWLTTTIATTATTTKKYYSSWYWWLTTTTLLLLLLRSTTPTGTGG